MTLPEFYAHCQETHQRYRSWRWGQAVFNTLYSIHPKLADEVRGTNKDPFYSAAGDPNGYEKLHQFTEWLEKNWPKEEETKDA